MKDFLFHNPVRIVFGAGRLDYLGSETAPFAKKVLLLYGGGSVLKSGALDRARKSLDTAGVKVTEFGGVKSNPSIDHAREGVLIVRRDKLDAVVALGGGSVMDEAKAIAGGAMTTKDPWDFFTGAAAVEQAIPVITVPTLAATGSEMNGNSVMTNPATAEKLAIGSPKLYPVTSILDPSLTVSVPADYTGWGIADIFAHTAEPYFNGAELSAPLQDRLAEGLFTATMDLGVKLMRNLGDITLRAEILWASTLALNGMISRGRGVTFWEMHQMAHALGAMYDVPHGAALSAIIPGWLKYQKTIPKKKERIARFARNVFGADKSLDPDRAADEGIERLKQWFKSLGDFVPVTITELKIPDRDIPSIAGKILPGSAQGAMEDMTLGKVEQILRLCL